MASISIPPAGLSALQILSELTSEQFETLVSTLEDERGPTLGLPSLAEAVIASVGEGSGITEESLGSLIAMAVMGRNRGWNSQEAANALVDAYSETSDGGDKEELRRRLVRVLSAATVVTVTRTLGALATPGMLRGVEVRTDVRPVFENGDPVTAVIVHELMLRIHTRSGGADAANVTLDEEDVDLVMEALENAKERARALKALFEARDIPISSFMAEEGAEGGA